MQRSHNQYDPVRNIDGEAPVIQTYHHLTMHMIMGLLMSIISVCNGYLAFRGATT